MALKVGLQGLLALGIESVPGTPVATTTVVPFISNTLKGKHEILKDIAVRGSRAQNYTSVLGKQSGEGDVTVNVDTLNIGYFLKLATGTEIVNTVATGVYDHLFFTTVSGNTPLTATIVNYQGVDTQTFASMAVDKTVFEVKNALMTAKTTFKGFFPTNTGAITNQTVSGTLLSFNNYKVQLGGNLISASAAAATPVTDFSVTIENNAEIIWESGSPTPSRVTWKALHVAGSFVNYFESVTERNNYYNLNKQSLIMTASGIALPSSTVESLKINLAKLAYTDVEITTGSDAFFAVKTTFEAEVDPIQGKQFDVILRNYRSTAYS